MSKPIIRHCRNCEYRESYFRWFNDYCNVKHKRIDKGISLRMRALLCPYYKQKGSAE